MDWPTIQRRPKILIGYSAVSALLLGVYARAGLVPFHGPMVFDGFSEVPDLLPYTRAQLERVLFTAAPAGALRPPPEWTTDAPREDRARELRPNPGWRWLRPGRARGPLLAANLSAARTLAGTAYWPTFADAILCVREVWLFLSDLQRIDQSLTRLRLLGVLDQITGLVVGKLTDALGNDERALEQLVLGQGSHVATGPGRGTAGRHLPILAGVDFGHTDSRPVLPLGVRASLAS